MTLNGGIDTQTLSRDESYKVPGTACAFANSSGGVIAGDGFDPASMIPSGIPYSVVEEGIYVPPLAWHRKPAVYHGRVYRRIEGQNVISGLRARVIMAGDSREPSRDDFPVSNITLREESVSKFHMKVTEINAAMKNFSRDEFLRRIGAYSGEYMTFAGALMFGDILRVRAVLDYAGGYAEISAVNIWDSLSEILPRLTAPLSSKCAAAFREMFVNSLLHADYNAGNDINILITSDPPRVSADNPGTIRGTVRNHRLARMLVLSGITRKGFSGPHGLDIIRGYMPSFSLSENMLELRTSAAVTLEGRAGLPEPVML